MNKTVQNEPKGKFDTSKWTVGNIQEFNFNTSDWKIYEATKDNYFEANNIMGDKRRSISLNVLDETLIASCDQCSPVQPERKSYNCWIYLKKISLHFVLRSQKE